MVTTRTDALLCDLLSMIEELTHVPVNGQKLIVNGKALTSSDHDKKISDCRISPASKVMLLGRRYDANSDEVYQKVLEVEQKSLEVAKRFQSIADEVEGVEKGFLPKEHHSEALKGLNRRAKGCSEEFMRCLEALDTLRFEDHQSMAKNKRKSVANTINSRLDQLDAMTERIKARM